MVMMPKDYERVMKSLPLSKKDEEAIGKIVETSSEITIADIRLKTLSVWIFFNILCQYITHHVDSHLKKEHLERAMRRNFHF